VEGIQVTPIFYSGHFIFFNFCCSEALYSFW